jgi:hypothetical protein
MRSRTIGPWCRPYFGIGSNCADSPKSLAQEFRQDDGIVMFFAPGSVEERDHRFLIRLSSQQWKGDRQSLQLFDILLLKLAPLPRVMLEPLSKLIGRYGSFFLSNGRHQRSPAQTHTELPAADCARCRRRCFGGNTCRRTASYKRLAPDAAHRWRHPQE